MSNDEIQILRADDHPLFRFGLRALLGALLVERLATNGDLRALLMVGLLGAITTFSTFSIETLMLIEQGALARAGGNILHSVDVCVLDARMGVVVARSNG